MTAPIAHQPGQFSIGYVDADHFLGPYSWTSDRDGNLNPVLHARFQWQDGEIDGFAKPFCPHNTFQATQALNEVTGWLIARACGLPVAERAFFSVINADELPAYCGPLPLPAPDADGKLLCFTTQAMSNTAVRGRYNTDMLVREQSAWPLCDATIAFDEAVANSDRHAFNLLRRAENDFALIDHGFLLRDPCSAYPVHWEGGALGALTNRPFPNLLHKNTYHLLGRSSKSSARKGLDNCAPLAATIEATLPKLLFELAFWCSKLTPGKSAEWLHFLRQRTTKGNLEHLLNGRFGLLTLHA